jgi:hypothetical protein
MADPPRPRSGKIPIVKDDAEPTPLPPPPAAPTPPPKEAVTASGITHDGLVFLQELQRMMEKALREMQHIGRNQLAELRESRDVNARLLDQVVLQTKISQQIVDNMSHGNALTTKLTAAMNDLAEEMRRARKRNEQMEKNGHRSKRSATG